jgi:hypothetical protein
MRKTKKEQKTKPKLNDYAKRLAGTVYLQVVLPEQNDIIPLPTIKSSTTSGNTVYKPPLVAWREVVWHEAALQYH